MYEHDDGTAARLTVGHVVTVQGRVPDTFAAAFYWRWHPKLQSSRNLLPGRVRSGPVSESIAVNTGPIWLDRLSRMQGADLGPRASALTARAREITRESTASLRNCVLWLPGVYPAMCAEYGRLISQPPASDGMSGNCREELTRRQRAVRS